MDDVAPEGVLDGRVLAGKLRLDHRLATGAMGEVWRARHLGLDKDVAVKILRTDRPLTDDMTERFIREARTASRLDHNNSVSVLDFGRDPSGPLYLAMELLEGQTLRQTLFERGRFPLPEACQLMSQVLAALAAAHSAGILHRDIKPSNIMLVPRQDDDGNPNMQVKVCDFGLAKFSNQAETLRGTERRLVGTPLYMSPEQAVSELLDERSDLYACGVVFFEMLTGRPPFEAERAVSVLMKHCASPIPKASNLVDSLPAEVDTLITTALGKDRSERFQSAREFRTAVLDLNKLPNIVPEQSNNSSLDTSYFIQPVSTGNNERLPKNTPEQPKLPSIEAQAMLEGQEQTFELPLERPVEATVSPPISGAMLPLIDGTAIETAGVKSYATESLPRPPLEAAELVPPIRSFEEKAQAPATDTRFLWERYALSPYRRAPARGFWLLDGQTNRIGPLTFDELCLALRLEAHEGSLPQSYVATDPRPQTWRPAEIFLRTLHSRGVSLLEAPSALRSDASGWLNPTTFPSLIALATREAMTGRIIVASSRTAKSAFFEVHLVAGSPTFIETNELNLQLPAVLIERGAFSENDLPNLVNDAWSNDTSLAVSVRRLTGVDLEEHRSGVMRSRLRRILKMAEGTWVADGGFQPEERRPFARSLLEILPRLAREALPRSTIEAALLPHLGAALSTYPGVDTALEDLGFTSKERTIAEELLAADRLELALPTREELRNAYATVAYLLVATTQAPTSL